MLSTYCSIRVASNTRFHHTVELTRERRAKSAVKRESKSTFARIPSSSSSRCRLIRMSEDRLSYFPWTLLLPSPSSA